MTEHEHDKIRQAALELLEREPGLSSNDVCNRLQARFGHVVWSVLDFHELERRARDIATRDATGLTQDRIDTFRKTAYVQPIQTRRRATRLRRCLPDRRPRSRGSRRTGSTRRTAARSPGRSADADPSPLARLLRVLARLLWGAAL